MKIEMDNNTASALMCAFAVAAIVAISLGGCHFCEKTKQEAVKAGLQQVQDKGQSFHWEKPGSE